MERENIFHGRGIRVPPNALSCRSIRYVFIKRQYGAGLYVLVNKASVVSVHNDANSVFWCVACILKATDTRWHKQEASPLHLVAEHGALIWVN